MSTVPRVALRRATPGQAASGVVHHGTMLLAMVPCLALVHQPMLHAGGALLLYALCVATARRCRRDDRHLPVLVDELAMLALLVAGFLAGHASGAPVSSPHHGGQGAVQLAHLVAVATALAWLLARAHLWRELARGGWPRQLAFAGNATMLVWMLVATLAR